MGASRPGLLESGAYLLELAEVMGELLSAEEVGSACDSEVFDTEVNPEDRSVLGGVPFGIGLGSAEADVRKVVAVTGGERAFRDAPLVRVEVLPLVAIVGVGKGKVTPDATLRRRERHGIVIGVMVRVSYFTVGGVKVGLLTFLPLDRARDSR